MLPLCVDLEAMAIKGSVVAVEYDDYISDPE